MKFLFSILFLLNGIMLYAQADIAKQKSCGTRIEFVANGGAAIPRIHIKYSVGYHDATPGTAFNAGVDFTFNRKNRMFAPIAGIRAGVLGFRSYAVYVTHDPQTNVYTSFGGHEKLFNYILMASGGIAGSVPLSKKIDLCITARTGIFMAGWFYDNKLKRPGLCTELTTGVCFNKSTSIALRAAFMDSWFEPDGVAGYLTVPNVYNIYCAGLEIKQRIPCMRRRH